MFSITDAQIECIKRRKPSELRQACEKDLFSGKDWFIATAGRILTVLEKLSIEEALHQTFEIITQRLLVFIQRFTPKSRQKLLSDISKIVDSNDKLIATAARKSANFLSYLSREEVTVINHLIKAFNEYNIAKKLSFVSPLAIPILFLSLEHAYAGQDRFAKDDKVDRKNSIKRTRRLRSLKYSDARLKTCDLLDELRPEKGWKDENEAATDIMEKLKEYLDKEKIRYPSSQEKAMLKKRLIAWMKEHDLVKLAFEQNKQRNA
ncbi:hypothetical protein [Pseudomonas syringae group genomosp. 7]|uniref:hypothetical protein n=1 Tax=Pseudomonas syringae group genomosp. 7 TaxID=251699 RepID=UPI0006D63F3E|nr:hypothetical protein [Pseudomonas syringae group genomosp. 7]UNB63766.1 hypothetical protein MME54_02835 [Pseudomonas syringae pv. helianthi]